MSLFSFRERQWLYQQMRELSEDDIRYIYRVIRKNNEQCSVNTNGIFFDLERCSDNTLTELLLYYKSLKCLY